MSIELRRYPQHSNKKIEKYEETSSFLEPTKEFRDQQFQLTLAALSLFGIFFGLLLQGTENQLSVFFACEIFIIILTLISWYGLSIRKYHRIVSTYRRVKRISDWEEERHQYRKFIESFSPYTRPRSIIFAILSLITFGFPFAYQAMTQKGQGTVSISEVDYVIYVIVGLACILWLVLSGVFGLSLNKKEDRLKNDWLEILNPCSVSGVALNLDINARKFTLKTEDYGIISVVTNSGTRFYSGRNAASMKDMANGMKVFVSICAVCDKGQSTITADTVRLSKVRFG